MARGQGIVYNAKKVIQLLVAVCSIALILLSTIEVTTVSYYITNYNYQLLMLLILDILRIAALVLSVIHFFESWNATDIIINRVIATCILIAKLLILLFSLLNFISGVGYFGTWSILVSAVAFQGQDEIKIIKPICIIASVNAIILFVFSMTRIIENNRGSAFGFMYRTHCASYLLSVVLAYCWLFDGEFSWFGELGLLSLFIFNLLFVKGKTLTICLALLIVATLLRHYRKLGSVPFQDKIQYGSIISTLFFALYYPVEKISIFIDRYQLKRYKRAATKTMEYIYLICAGIVITLTLFYRRLQPLLDYIPVIDTLKNRFLQGAIAFEEFPIRLFGNLINQRGWSGSNSDYVHWYYAIDSGYINLLMRYGLLAFIALLGAMTLIQSRLRKRKRIYSMFLLTLFAVDALMNYWMVSMAFNWFALFCCSALKEQSEISVTHNNYRHSIKKLIAICVSIGLLGIWCFTAYPISTWIGHASTSNATIVICDGLDGSIGGDDLNYAKLKSAVRQLGEYGDNKCIISGDEDSAYAIENMLLNAGVVKSRIFRDTNSNSIEDVLNNSQTIMVQNHLPTRLTICTFDMFGNRIEDKAHFLHIPINILSADMPLQWYIANFLVEQWRMLTWR